MTFFMNMRLRHKGWLMTFVVVCALVAVTGLASLSLERLKAQVAMISTEAMPRVELINATEQTLQTAHFEFTRTIALANTGLTGDTLQRQIDKAVAARQEIEALVEQVAAGQSVPLIAETRETLVTYLDANAGALDMLAFDPIAGTAFATTADQAFAEIVRIAGDIIANERSAIETAALNAITVAGAETLQFQVVASICLLLSVIVSTLIIRSISKPVTQMTDNMLALAKRNLDIEIAGANLSNEIGDMASALNVFRASAVESARLQKAVSTAIEHARQGDFSHQVAEQFEEASLESIKSGVNALLANVRHGLQATGEVLTALSSGDLTTRMSGTFYGDFHRLQADLNSTAEQFESAMAQIAQSADTVNANAAEISSSAQDLATRTERSATNLTRTASAMDGLKDLVGTAAKRLEKVNALVQKTHGNTQTGEKVVEEVVAAMGEISAFSRKIEEVVSVINDISFQTNLLALNAGVEAARAGESGRGFSVVASEVRALAQRAADSSKEIEALIAQSSERVNRGVELVGKTSDALQVMAKDISQVADNVSEIASSAASQSAGISEATEAIAEVDRATQQNAAMFEETTAASMSLTDSSRTLKQLSSRFHTSPTLVGSDIGKHAPEWEQAPPHAAA